MRLIGHLATENNARTFGDFLCVQGIDNQIEFETDSGWAVWIRDEDRIGDALRFLAKFQTNPLDPSYADQARGAAQKRQVAEAEEAAYRKRVIDGRTLLGSMAGYGFGAISLSLILISVAVGILSNLGDDLRPIAKLFISEYVNAGLMEIRQGQVWRLVTPIFIHFGILHILFNLMFIRDLGSLIEARQGAGYFLVLVVVIAALSNLGQYYANGPLFGGMSGVCYGLLGYVWMRSKFDPASGYFLNPTTLTIMLIWLVACYVGVVGRVANTAHTVGLIVGAAWGYAYSWRRG